jgi:hypothetical protein
MIVSKASNASEATSSKTMGLLESGGSTNAKVNVITEGLLAGLNTDGTTAGAPVWLGTDGNLIYGLVNKPQAPAHLVFIGIVTRVNANNGEIFVRPQNGFELNELHNVLLDSDASTADNEVLAWDLATQLWKNQTAAEAGLATASHTHALENISNVSISGTPTDGQALAYEASTSLWKPANVGTYGNIDGGTPSSVYGGIPPIDGGGVV